MSANPLLATWAAALWRACWQGGLALLLVWAVSRAWKTMPPRLREWLWRLAYLKLLFAWVCAGAVTLAILPTSPSAPAPDAGTATAPSSTVIAPSPEPVAPMTKTQPVATPASAPALTAPALVNPTPTAAAPVPTHHWQFADLLPWLGLLWLLGLTFGIIRLLLALRLVRRLRAEARMVGVEEILRLRVQVVKQMGLRRAPMLMAHPSEGPLLLGTLHPVIIVPEAMLHGDGEALRLALAHELAHVRRYDILWGWLPAIAEILFFFHPLVYPAHRECRLAQEMACDALAIEQMDTSPQAYGAMLLNGIAHRLGKRPVPSAVGILESFHTLQRRLSAMNMLHALSRRQQVLTGLLVGMVALAGLVPWRLSAADEFPNIHIPDPPPLPMPNARDYYEKAGDLLVLRLPPTNEPIKFTYIDISDMARLGIAPGVGVTPFGNQPSPSLTEMQGLMQANQPAFAMLRQGFAYEYGDSTNRASNEISRSLSIYRNLMCALSADSYTRRCAGDWEGAMDSCLDGLSLGEEIPHARNLLYLLTGIAIQAGVRRQAWEIVPHLSAQKSTTAMKRLEAISAREVSYADIMLRQKWHFENKLLATFRTPNWQEQMVEAFHIDAKMKPRLKQMSKSYIITTYDRYVDTMIARAKKPCAAQGAEPPSPDNPLLWNSSFIDPYRKAQFKSSCNTTYNALLLVTLALQAYHAEHNTYPDTLAALTHAYLKAVPADLFGSGESLHYRRTDTGYVLYSIGPDGKDDGGVPSIDGQIRPQADEKMQKEHGYLKIDSTGDIVAGVNIL